MRGKKYFKKISKIKPEILEESSLLQVKVLAGPLTVHPGVGDVRPREVHQVAVPPQVRVEGTPHSVPHRCSLQNAFVKIIIKFLIMIPSPTSSNKSR